MARFTKREWVCLAAAAELEALRRAQDEGSMSGRPLQAPMWRQLVLTATRELITLELCSVDEEAARGGYFSGGFAMRRLTLSWEDLSDFDGIARRLEHEQVCVLAKVSDMFAAMREHMRPLRLALAA